MSERAREGVTTTPMTLGDMRRLGVRSVALWCAACRRGATAAVDAFADAETVPALARRFRCSSCGGRPQIQPDWTKLRTGPAV